MAHALYTSDLHCIKGKWTHPSTGRNKHLRPTRDKISKDDLQGLLPTILLKAMTPPGSAHTVNVLNILKIITSQLNGQFTLIV
jgi:hypothetical protein